MTCDFCNNIAIIFITHAVGGDVENICLCEECSKDQSLIVKKGLTEILGEGDIVAEENEMNSVKESPNLSKTCICGLTLEVLQKTGRLGCPKCYQTFKSEIQDRIVKSHNGVEHKGKQIDIPMTLETLKERREALEQKLQVAIASEEFEEAARMRDLIVSLDTQIAKI